MRRTGANLSKYVSSLREKQGTDHQKTDFALRIQNVSEFGHKPHVLNTCIFQLVTQTGVTYLWEGLHMGCNSTNLQDDGELVT